MGDTSLAVLAIGGIVLFIVGLSVLKAVMSRGLDKVFDFGMKTVNKERNEKIAQVVAVPLVLKSAASLAEIMAALDAIVNAKTGPPGLGAVLYETARTDEKITYAMGNQFYPQQFVAEVRVGERDGMTQVVFKVLHLPEKNGMYAAAYPMMRLREAVQFAVEASGDPEKLAEGVRLYGPPEPGSPRALANRKKQILVWTGTALLAVVLLKFAAGVYVRELPLWFVVGAAGGGLIWLAARMEQSPLSRQAGDTVPSGIDALAAEGQPANASPSPLAGALAKASGLNGKTKVLLIVAVVVVVFFVGGTMVTNSVRAARDRQLEGNYAQQEADGIAQAEADAQAEQAAFEAEGDSSDGSADENTTPNGHRRWMQLPDILGLAPEDGSSWRAMVTYTSSGVDGDTFGLEVDDISLGGSDPDYIHDVDLYVEDFESCYVDDQLVSAEQFLEFVQSGSDTLGSIEFTQDKIVKANAYSQNYVPADGY